MLVIRTWTPQRIQPTNSTSPVNIDYVITASGSSYTATDPYGNVIYSGSSASTVIQSAINGLTSGRTSEEKILLQGNFILTKTITIANYMILELDGKVTLANEANCYMVYANNKSNFEITGGEWDGNKAGQTSSGSSIRGFQILNSNNFSINGIKMYEVTNDAIALEYCSEAIVDNNELYNCGGAVLGYNYCSNGFIRNNVGHDCSAGIYLYCEDDGIVQHIDNNIVTGNTISRVQRTGITVSLRGPEDYGRYNVIAWNTCIDCGTDGTHGGVNIGWGVTGSGVINGYSDYNEVHDNVITQTGAYQVSSQLVCQGNYNHFYNNKVSNVPATAALITGHDNVWENNTIDGVVGTGGKFGIEVSYANNNKILNNIVKNVSHSCIWVASTSTGNQLTGNTIQNWAKYGAILEGNNNTLINNKFYGPISSAIYNPGTGNTVSPNENYP